MPREYSTIPVESRFQAKVERTSDCWLWHGTRDPHGYGILWVRGRNVRAHRLSWELHYGPVPAGMNVLHHCDNPTCVRPDHLFLGTHADNVADKVAKGRQASGERHGARRHRERMPRGERNGNARLAADDVREIRRLYAVGTATQTALAARFGVTQRVIWQIVHRLTWRHVE